MFLKSLTLTRWIYSTFIIKSKCKYYLRIKHEYFNFLQKLHHIDSINLLPKLCRKTKLSMNKITSTHSTNFCFRKIMRFKILLSKKFAVISCIHIWIFHEEFFTFYADLWMGKRWSESFCFLLVLPVLFSNVRPAEKHIVRFFRPSLCVKQWADRRIEDNEAVSIHIRFPQSYNLNSYNSVFVQTIGYGWKNRCYSSTIVYSTGTVVIVIFFLSFIWKWLFLHTLDDAEVF